MEPAKIFGTMDTNNDGVLSPDEIVASLLLRGVDPDAVSELFAHLDADRSGYVTLEEFIAGFDAYSNATKPRDPLALVKCWDHYSTRGWTGALLGDPPASVESDRIHILNSIVGQPLDSEPPTSHPLYTRLNAIVRGRVAAAVWDTWNLNTDGYRAKCGTTQHEDFFAMLRTSELKKFFSATPPPPADSLPRSLEVFVCGCHGSKLHGYTVDSFAQFPNLAVLILEENSQFSELEQIGEMVRVGKLGKPHRCILWKRAETPQPEWVSLWNA